MKINKDAMAAGGHGQSKNLYWCTKCQQGGRGNRFKQFHLDQGQCEGKGVKNYYARLSNKRAGNIF